MPTYVDVFDELQRRTNVSDDAVALWLHEESYCVLSLGQLFYVCCRMLHEDSKI
jgi:hypothetical protein